MNTFLTVCVIVVSVNAQEDDDGLALELGQRDSNDDSSEDSDEVIAANANADTGRASPNDGSRISFVKDEGGVDSITEKKKEALGNIYTWLKIVEATANISIRRTEPHSIYYYSF